MSEAVWLLVAANKTRHRGTSLVVQGLRIQVPSAGGLGLIRGQETRSHMLELGPGTAKIKIIVKKKKKTHICLFSASQLHFQPAF